MGLLDNFEKGLERAVNGAFAKTFRSGLQPVEITSALRRELDTQAAIVSRDRILAPNRFTVRMASADHARMTRMGPALIDELTSLVQSHATSQHYQFAGPVIITLTEDTGLSEGMVQVDSSNEQGDVTWAPVLEVAGRTHALDRPRTVIGRGHEADITVNDPGISRKHVEIQWDGHRARVQDLGSTNGTQLDGKRVGQANLEPGSVVTIGRTRIVFRVLPQASPDSSRPGNPGRRDMDGFWGPAS